MRWRTTALALCLGCAAVNAGDLAVVIDDVGHSRRSGDRVLALPAPLTVAVLPFTPFAHELSRDAVARGHQVIVHLPMQSSHGHALGPLGLTEGIARDEFLRRARAAMDAVPLASGASNHMGSLLTTRLTPMRWLMSAVASRPGWLFLDSRTTARSVAAVAAREARLRVLARDIFLDHERHRGSIRRQLRAAADLAIAQGRAIAIGHPHAQTLSVLEEMLPALIARGVRLVTLAQLAPQPGALRALRVGYGSPSGGQAASTSPNPNAPSNQLATGMPPQVAGW